MSGKTRPSLREKTLENVKHSNLSETDKKCIAEVFKRYEKAEEKQIPKKPINKTGLNNTAAFLYENCSIVVCPECRGRLKLKSKGKYCDKCGQALDWSEE